MFMNRVHEQCPKIDSGKIPSRTGLKTGRVHRVHCPKPARAPRPRAQLPGRARPAPVPRLSRALRPAPRLPPAPLAQRPHARAARLPSAPTHARLRAPRAPSACPTPQRAQQPSPLLTIQFFLYCDIFFFLPSQAYNTTRYNPLYLDLLLQQPTCFDKPLYCNTMKPYCITTQPSTSFIICNTKLYCNTIFFFLTI